MRIGVDSYAYHRLLGEIRPGRLPPPRALAGGSADVVRHAASLGLDVVSLETVFLGTPVAASVAALPRIDGLELALAHGHPEGLRYGADAAALADLRAWLDVAATCGVALVRTVAAGPRLRPLVGSAERVAGTVRALRAAAAHAAERGVRLCLENHADLDLREMEAVLGALDGLPVGLCFDTSNWARVGCDPVAAACALGPHVDAVHLKDHVVGPDDGVTGPRNVALGTGEVDLAAVLAPILAVRPDAPVLVELGHLGGVAVDELAVVEASVRWLRAHAAASAPDAAR